MARNQCSWRNQKENAKSILPLIHKYKEIILFDTETTGLGRNAKIIQFSAVHYAVKAGYRLEELEKMDVYLNPEEPLEDKIIEITGITDDMLKDALTEKELGLQIFSFMNACPLWAAYNCSFDIRMLNQMSSRINVLIDEKPCLDVLEMARDFVDAHESGSHKLGDVLEYLYPDDHFQFHSSIEDVRATAKIMSNFLNQYRQVFVSSSEHKRQLKLEWAKACMNPHQPSQQRIKLMLNEGQYGDIFWDIVGNKWSCKSTKTAKAIFNSVDLANLEQQVLNRYGWRYDARDMSTLSKKWMAEVRKSA